METKQTTEQTETNNHHIDKYNILRWFSIICLIYFIFSGILSYMMAGGADYYIIKYDPVKHELIIGHVVDDGESKDEQKINKKIEETEIELENVEYD